MIGGAIKLQGKQALVTGRSRGIGRGIALQMAVEGASVAFPATPAQASNNPPTFVLAANSGIYVVSYTDAHEGGRLDANIERGTGFDDSRSLDSFRLR